MKKILSIITLVAAFSFSLLSAELVFTWDHNPPAELVGAYRMEYIKLPVITNWTLLTTIPATTNVVTVKGVQGGYSYKFRIFATNALGVGTNSSTVIELPTSKPTAVSGYQLTNSVK